jgi:hypothetical protein
MVLVVLGAASPATGFAGAAPPSVPPAPDYAHADSWAAWPGRPGAVDTVAPGLPVSAVADAQRVDVFFIHPTTYLSGAAPNARYDEPGATSTQIEQGVMRFQASVFNACCRIYAPHYRQATIRAFMGSSDEEAAAAYSLAYADVLRAFDYYIAHENHGRPFIIASHSQGTLHAIRLVQERLAGKPLTQQLVVAYLIGYPMPLQLEQLGLTVCREPQQTGCLVDWNTVKEGSGEGRREHTRIVWLEGRYQPILERPVACVNPLSWTVDGQAAAAANLGALPGVPAGKALLPVVPGLTGARCHGGLLEVSIPMSQRHGFANLLTLFGSYHILDYNLFYTNIRVNVQQRVSAYQSGSPYAEGR